MKEYEKILNHIKVLVSKELSEQIETYETRNAEIANQLCSCIEENENYRRLLLIWTIVLKNHMEIDVSDYITILEETKEVLK